VAITGMATSIVIRTTGEGTTAPAANSITLVVGTMVFPIKMVATARQDRQKRAIADRHEASCTGSLFNGVASNRPCISGAEQNSSESGRLLAS